MSCEALESDWANDMAAGPNTNAEARRREAKR
jgi:hypothetical protein